MMLDYISHFRGNVIDSRGYRRMNCINVHNCNYCIVFIVREEFIAAERRNTSAAYYF